LVNVTVSALKTVAAGAVSSPGEDRQNSVALPLVGALVDDPLTLAIARS
jgi:hypothetical protein